MDLMHKFDPLLGLLLVVGGLNWALIALIDTNVVTEILGTGTLTDIVYVLVGVAAVMQIPKMLEGLGLDLGGFIHPKGA